MQTWASFINVFYFFSFTWNAMRLDQVLVKFLIYHTIIGAYSESKQSSDLARLVPELSTFLQMWCIMKQIVFFCHVFGLTEAIIHCACALYNNEAVPLWPWSQVLGSHARQKSSPAYISTHTHHLSPLSLIRRWEIELSSLIPLHQRRWLAYYVLHRWRVGHTSLHTPLLPH